MKNPAAIDQPKLQTPLTNRKNGRKNGKGNLPYLKFRRKLRKSMFEKM